MDKKDFLKQYQSKEWYEISKRIKARGLNPCCNGICSLSCLYSIQIYTDIVACKKLGIDSRELVEHAYPEMLASYDKVKCGKY